MLVNRHHLRRQVVLLWGERFDHAASIKDTSQILSVVTQNIPL